MFKQLTNNRPPLIFSVAACLSLAACTQTDTVESALQEIQSILTTSNTDNEVHYRISYDADFPCSVHLQESWKDADSDWRHTYRYDLADIESNTFVQSKNGRRTITYGGYKISTDGIKKTFREIRINNIRIRASLSIEDQQLIIKATNKAIALCEEKYSFE